VVGTKGALRGPIMRFIIATRHFSGLGFAMRLLEEGHEVLMAFEEIDDRRLAPRHDLLGRGIVERRPIAEVVSARGGYRDAVWVWDENHSVDANECLRSEGFRVLGGGGYADTMEHDRDACLRHVAAFGVAPPPSEAFDDPAAALRFVEERPETAYVFKPDHGETHETWLPQSAVATEANLELRQHLRSLRDPGPFVLQERKDGIETNVEVWFVDGQPKFAFMTIESKKRLTGDLGDLAGCAFDFAFVIPVESRAVAESVGKLYPAYEKMRYTGFGDANFIAARDGVWFFEKCERFGYNAHPNLFWNLNRAPLGETFAALVDGSFEPDFAPGFGATCSMYMDHPLPGQALYYPEAVAKNLYFMDVHRDGDVMLTAGYNDLVVIACGYGYTIETSWEEALRSAWQVRFPGRSFRVDGAGVDFQSSPLRRYEALRAMGYI
jgi:phosphoribosylamine-glycine ligase